MVTLAWRGEAGFAVGAGPKEFAEGASYISRSLPRALVRLRVSGMDRLQDDGDGYVFDASLHATQVQDDGGR